MTEEWRPTHGYYEVSNTGRVRRAGGLGINNARHNGKILKQFVDERGYFKVSLCIDGGKVNFKTHRLVALAFLGRPNGLTVNHKDGNKRNNAAENLEYLSRADNVAHAKAHGLYPRAEKSPSSKLSSVAVREIRASKESGRVLGKKYGVSQKTISSAKSGQSWKSVAALSHAPAAEGKP